MSASIPWQPTTDDVDRTLSRVEDRAAVPVDPSQPDFWEDMCAAIYTNSSEYVNLRRNPERHTGYNGSAVWAAIYEENCFRRIGGSGTTAKGPDTAAGWFRTRRRNTLPARCVPHRRACRPYVL